MKVGIIGLGTMVEGMSHRMMKAGIETWVYCRNHEKAQEAFENSTLNKLSNKMLENKENISFFLLGGAGTEEARGGEKCIL